MSVTTNHVVFLFIVQYFCDKAYYYNAYDDNKRNDND